MSLANGALDQAHQNLLVKILSSHQADIEQAAKQRLAGELDSSAPHQLLMVDVDQYGDGWRASYSSVLALGKTPREACAAFDKLWDQGRSPEAHEDERVVPRELTKAGLVKALAEVSDETRIAFELGHGPGKRVEWLGVRETRNAPWLSTPMLVISLRSIA